jgi:hypothetical protein
LRGEPGCAAVATSLLKPTLKAEGKRFDRSAVMWKLGAVAMAFSLSRQVVQTPQDRMLNSEPGGLPAVTNNEATADHVNAEILEELELYPSAILGQLLCEALIFDQVESLRREIKLILRYFWFKCSPETCQ